MLNNHEEREAISNVRTRRQALRLVALGVLAIAIIAALPSLAGLARTADIVHAQNQSQAATS